MFNSLVRFSSLSPSYLSGEMMRTARGFAPSSNCTKNSNANLSFKFVKRISKMPSSLSILYISP